MMDSNSVLQKLEEASRILLASPNLVTSEQRHQAENIFLEFRRISYPYDTCRFILEHSKNDYAQYQAASTIKTSIVREWATLHFNDVEQLRMFLLQYVISHAHLQSYVREEVFQAIAVILKRGILDKESVAKEKIFDEVTQLISTGDLSMQVLACSLLSALLDEFSSNSKSSGAGFTWEFHIRCKRLFENDHLLNVLHFTLQVLNELVKLPVPLDRGHLTLLVRFLSICEQLFTWEFLPPRLTRRHMVPFGVVNQPSFKPTEVWRDTVLNPQLLDLFFELLNKISYNGEMTHKVLLCLSQLASLNGSVFLSDDAQLSYLSEFVSRLIPFLTQLKLQECNALGVASIFENLLRWFKVELFASLPACTVLEQFVKLMTQHTCDFIYTAMQEKSDDNNLYNEALQKMLFSWTTLLADANEHFSVGRFKKEAIEIFNHFVQSHLSDWQLELRSSDGSRKESSDEEEYEEDELEDREQFCEQLMSIGIIAREIPEHSLPTLARLIDERIERLHQVLEKIASDTVLGSGDQETQSSDLICQFEDLHWLLMIAACVMTDDTLGETALIPTPLLRHSILQCQLVDQHCCMMSVTDPVLALTQPPNKVDAIIRVLSSVLRLLRLESTVYTQNLSSHLSPQLDSTCMWFLRRFVDTYLMPAEDNYGEMSVTLANVLGDLSGGVVSLVDQILAGININIHVWHSESSTLTDTLQLLVSLVTKKKRCEAVLRSNHFWHMVSAVADNSFPFNSLPAESRRLLYKALVYSCSSMTEQRQEFWQKMVCEPMANLSAIVCSDSFRNTKEEPVTKATLTAYLDTLIGCCQASRLGNQTELFHVLEPSLTITIKLLDVCHTNEQLVQLCLEVFAEVVSSMIASLDISSSERLYQQCLLAIQTYAKYHSAIRTVEVDAEEDMYRDILLILELLLHLMSKDLVDFGLNGANEVASVSATEVVIFGLTVIIPLMNTSLLQFPNLCAQYFKLLAFISEMRPDKLLELPDNLLQMVLESVLLSLTQYGSDVSKSGFEFLTEMSTFIAQRSSMELLKKSHLCIFLQPVLNLILFEPFDVDLLDVMSGCLFYLISLHPDEYKILETAILEQQKSAAHFTTLAKAFENLTPTAIPSKGINRQNKIKFVEALNIFLLDVKGFLCTR